MGVAWRAVEAERMPSAGAPGWFARSGGEEGERPMDVHTYASVVEDNYQRLADLLLSPDPDASKVQRLLALVLLPAPPIPRGYAIWSEGLLAEAFACFPTAAFPALWERLRTATANEDTSRLYKALTMWGDRFATALSAWLASDTLQLHARAIQGLTLYAKGLNALCDAEAPSLETRLYQAQNERTCHERQTGTFGV
jgi:hypothetical protein